MRRGSAPLEFIIVLPVLAIVFIFLFQAAASSWTKSSVTIAARQEAWRGRYEQNRGKPFDREDLGHITADASDDIIVSPITRGFPQPRADHTILSGTWDHRSVRLNDRQPNFGLALEVARRGPVEEAQSRLRDFENLLGSLDEIGNGFSQFGGGLNAPINLNNFLSSGSIDQQLEQAANQAVNDEIRRRFPGWSGDVESLGDQLVQAAIPDQYGPILSLIEKIRGYSSPSRVERIANENGKKRAAELDAAHQAFRMLSDDGELFDGKKHNVLRPHFQTLGKWRRRIEDEDDEFDITAEENRQLAQRRVEGIRKDAIELLAAIEDAQRKLQSYNFRNAGIKKRANELLAEMGVPAQVRIALTRQLRFLQDAIEAGEREKAERSVVALEEILSDLHGNLNDVSTKYFPAFLKILEDGSEKAREPVNVGSLPQTSPN